MQNTTTQLIEKNNALKAVRQRIIEKLWQDYYTHTPQVKQIHASLKAKGIKDITLDHLAIIDLPGPHTGIKPLRDIFHALGFQTKGEDYLPEKQNDFLWLAEEDSIGSFAQDVLPQVVVADFRLSEIPDNVRSIIEKYSQQAAPAPIAEIKRLAKLTKQHDRDAADALTDLVCHYLSNRDWPTPTVNEFNTVRAFNELIAWVLALGRRPNHFTISVHLLADFKGLTHFHDFIENEVGLILNQDGGVIKGGKDTGIEQGSTLGTPKTLKLADGNAELPTGFVEFVWRYTDKAQPRLWDDYFTGFVARHANRVIQSLYVKD